MQDLLYIAAFLILSLLLRVRIVRFEGHQRSLSDEAPNVPTNPIKDRALQKKCKVQMLL
jgi:hypothetical protein